MNKRLYQVQPLVFILSSSKRNCMLSFFGKKEIKPKTTDRVFISSKAKSNAVVDKIRNNGNILLIFWFDDSYEEVQHLIQSNNLQAELYMAREIAAHDVHNKTVLFFEHYPLAVKERELLEKLQLKEAFFYSALDEPIFRHFGGDKIVSLMEKLGLSENETIEHAMISNAIKNAQEKLSTKVVIDHFAQSQSEWFSKNIVK